MRIENVMEVTDTFVRAYDYYKKLVNEDDGDTPDLKLSKAARMFGLGNIKKFKLYVVKKEQQETENNQFARNNKPY